MIAQCVFIEYMTYDGNDQALQEISALRELLLSCRNFNDLPQAEIEAIDNFVDFISEDYGTEENDMLKLTELRARLSTLRLTNDLNEKQSKSISGFLSAFGALAGFEFGKVSFDADKMVKLGDLRNALCDLVCIAELLDSEFKDFIGRLCEDNNIHYIYNKPVRNVAAQRCKHLEPDEGGVCACPDSRTRICVDVCKHTIR
ncbi:MAG: hypothetical protein FWD33_01840 [Alphaproteobacteria bacterium]|nr:hypothetical protein [Alphaproteobacteria bacterium]